LVTQLPLFGPVPLLHWNSTATPETGAPSVSVMVMVANAFH